MLFRSILPFLASIGLFGVFYHVKVKGKAAGIVTKIAPYTLGVYLLHENVGLRYTWQKWFGVEWIMQGASDSIYGNSMLPDVMRLLLGTGAAVVCVFAGGVIIDMVRERIFVLLHRIFLRFRVYRGMVALVEKADFTFKRN